MIPNLMAGGHGSLMSGDRRADLGDILKQLAAAAETNGFEAVLTPTGLWCEDAWLTTAALIDATETLKFLVAFRPGLTSPTLAAQWPRASNGTRREGFLASSLQSAVRPVNSVRSATTKEARYERGDEFLTVVRRLWSPTSR